MGLLFVFLLGFAFNWVLEVVNYLLQWFQMWISLKVSKIQVEINKLAECEQQGQEETFAVGFHYSESEQEIEYYEDDEDFED